MFDFLIVCAVAFAAGVYFSDKTKAALGAVKTKVSSLLNR